MCRIFDLFAEENCGEMVEGYRKVGLSDEEVLVEVLLRMFNELLNPETSSRCTWSSRIGIWGFEGVSS